MTLAMPVTYEIGTGRIRIIADGLYTYSEVVSAFTAAIDAAPARMPVLVDARGSRVNPPLQEIRDTARFADSISDGIGPRIALVVEGTLRFGLARMLATFGSTRGDLDYQAFRDHEEAERWLRE